jgi:hypothetical protein
MNIYVNPEPPPPPPLDQWDKGLTENLQCDGLKWHEKYLSTNAQDMFIIAR